MADPTLKFKIAILDETKSSLDSIKSKLTSLKEYTDGVSRSITDTAQALAKLGKSFNNQEMDGFIANIKKMQKALHQTDAFQIPALKDASTQINSIFDALNRYQSKLSKGLPSDMSEQMNKLVRSMSIAEKQLGSASLSTLETYRAQFGNTANDITRIVEKIKTSIREAFDGNGKLTYEGLSSLRSMSGLASAANVESWARKFQETLSSVEKGIGKYSAAMDSNLGLEGIINTINGITNAIINARAALSGKGILDPVVRKDAKNLEAIQELLQKLESQLQNFGNKSYPNILKGFMTSVNRVIEEINTSLGSLSKGSETAAISSILDTTNLKEKAQQFIIPFQDIEKKIQEIVENISKNISEGFDAAFSKNLSSTALVQSIKDFINDLGGMQEMLKNLETVVKSLDLERVIKNVAANAESLKAATMGGTIIQSQATRNNNAIAAIDRLLTRLNNASAEGVKLNFDTTGINSVIAKVQELRENVLKLQQSGGIENGFLKSEAFTNLASAANREIAAIQRAISEEKNKEAVNSQLQSSEKSLSRSMNDVAGSAQHQSRVMADIKSMAYQYLSIWSLKDILSDMFQITGELELQERSLEVILGNASAARQMYSQIRDLSQMSPYTFEDLLKSHRQLAAFGIEAKDIFNTLKSLSDIGAGLDVDVSRLILAYGHTRSYGYLSGIQNRQFETAGIDLVGALTQHYNKLAEAEQKAGRQAEFVTRADIFKRMRSRDIPFEDVQSVILDLDKPGGKFYNMQIRQFDTLGGKLRNLRNNYRIMMSEMGQSHHGMLTSLVDMINTLTENWQKFWRVLKSIALGYGAVKLAAVAAGQAVLSNNKKIWRAATTKGANARAISYLSGAENPRLRRNNVLTAGDSEFKRIRYARSLNNITKERIALTGRLSKAARTALLVETGLDKQRAMAIARLSPWKRGLMSLRLGFIQATAAVKAFTVSLLTNPMTWIFAIVGAITAIGTKINQMSQNAKEFGDNLRDSAKTNVEGINETLSEYKNLYNTRATVSLKNKKDNNSPELRLIDINDEELNAHNVYDVFEELKKKLESQSPLFDQDFYDIEKAENQTEQIEAMFNTLKRLEYVNKVIEKTSDNMEEAINAGHASWMPWTWFRGEDYLTNIGDFDKSVRSLKVKYGFNGNRAIDMLPESAGAISRYRQDTKRVAEQLGSIYSNFYVGDSIDADAMVKDFNERLNTAFANQKIMDDDSKRHIKEQLALGVIDALSGSAPDVAKAFADRYYETLIGGDLSKRLDNAITPEMDQQKAEETAQKTFNQLFDEAKKTWKGFNSWWNSQGEEDAQKYMDGFRRTMDNIIKGKLGIVEEWQRRAIKGGYFEINSTLKTKLRATTNIEDFKDTVRETVERARKSAKEEVSHIKTLQARLGIKFKVSATMDMGELNEQITRLEKDFNDMPRVAQYGGYGQSLKELIDSLKGFRGNIGTDKGGSRWLRDEGYGEGEKAEKERNKREQADNRHDSNIIKGLQARQAAIKKVYEWYKRWYDLLGNSDAAMDAAKKLVDATDIKGIDLNDLKSWETYVKLLERERDALNRVKIRRSENRERVDQIKTGYTDTINNGEADEFSRNQDRIASTLERQLELLSQQYDLYQKVYELTGDRDLAVQLSGRNVQNPRQSKADDYRQNIQTDFDNMRRSLNLETISLPFDELLNMDDEKIKQTIGTMLNVGDNGEILENNDKLALQYKSITEALKKWCDLEVDVRKEGAETYSQILGDLKDINTEFRKIDAKAATRKESLRNVGDKLSSDERERIEGIIDQEANTDKIQKTIGYITLMNDALSMGETDFVDNLDKAFDDLNGRLEAGTITASDYAKEFEKLQKISSDYHNKGLFGKDSSTTAFLQGGLTGQLQWVENHLRVRRATLSEDIKANNPNYTSAQINEIINSDEQIRTWEDLKDKIKDATGNIKSFSSIVNIVSSVFDGLQQAAQNLANMFDALGNEHMANFFSDFADVTGAIGSIFSPVSNILQNAMSGNIGGIISSAISAPISMVTSPITAFAKLHDKQIQRKIDKIQQDISKIEGYTSTIDKAQERTLGYDNGDLIRSYQQRYANNTETVQHNYSWNLFGTEYNETRTETRNKEGKAGEAMAAYYNAAGTGTSLSGYEQQYNLLLKKRQDYVDTYNAENSKKKKNKDSLVETQQKIAEIDDEIRFFSEDLANKLFSIDFKSWADQLGDALMTAFENGEDAADSFDNTVTSILQGIVKKMISVGVMEPLFERLRKELFGYTDENNNKHEGSFKISDPYGSRNEWMSDINEALGDEGYVREGIEASQVLFDSMEELANKYGNTLMNTNSDSMSSSIKGITETTADLLAAYLNAIRADVSVVRQVQSQFVYTLWPEYIKQITGYSSSLQSIDTNVQAIRSLMSENGALFEQVRTLRDDLHGLVTQQKYIRVN